MKTGTPLPELDPIQSIETGFAAAGGYFARASVAGHPPIMASGTTKDEAIAAVREAVPQILSKKGA